MRRLVRLWERELEATRAAHRVRRDAYPLAERVKRGLALDNLELDGAEATPGSRVLLWFKSKRSPKSAKKVEGSQFSIGDPVLLWRGEPDGREKQLGVLARRSATRLGIAVESGYAGFIDSGPVNLDQEAPETAFERGNAALRAYLKDDTLAHQRELLFGDEVPRFDAETPAVEFRDEGLNDGQRAAVEFSLRAQDIALIHGPPGTGKTRTLVEIVRQAVSRGNSVFVCAASNTAVDHLAERLLDAGVRPLRIGHPARVSAALESRCLDVLVEDTAEHAQATKFMAKATRLRARHARGERAKNLIADAAKAMRDARNEMVAARAAVLRRLRVVCSTSAGADGVLPDGHRFDLVVLDEATQAQDPIALCALKRGERLILAGDPRQLPPTVIDREAAEDGLGTTFFERSDEKWDHQATHLLTTQYRMSEALARFPSASMYDGRLEAHESVANHRLEELDGVSPDGERSSPWLFLDTSKKGWTEQRHADDASTLNEQHAKLTASEVQRLIERGVPAAEIAAISPYAAQVRLLRQLLQAEVAAGVEIGTVDGFQGREKEAVVVDLVRSNDRGDIGFLADLRRTNVAITRARRFLLIIGDSSTLSEHPFYRSLVAAARADGAWVAA